MTLKPSPGRRGDPVWLPEVLRHWGVTVKERPNWKNHGQGDFQDIYGVICHHTAGPNTSAEYIARNPGLGNGLSSQIHLGRDGVATMCGAGLAWHGGEGEWVAPAALRGYVTRPSITGPKSFTALNAKTIGIEAVNAGDGTQVWPEVQMDAYARICAAICWYLDFGVDRVLGHKEVTPSQKIDPNFDMGAFRVRVQNYLDNPPFEKKTETINEGDFPMALTRDEQYEVLGILRDLKTHYLEPKQSHVEGSTFKAPVHEVVMIGDRKLEEAHVKMFSETSGVQQECDEIAQAPRDAEKEATDAH